MDEVGRIRREEKQKKQEEKLDNENWVSDLIRNHQKSRWNYYQLEELFGVTGRVDDWEHFVRIAVWIKTKRAFELIENFKSVKFDISSEMSFGYERFYLNLRVKFSSGYPSEVHFFYSLKLNKKACFEYNRYNKSQRITNEHIYDLIECLSCTSTITGMGYILSKGDDFKMRRALVLLRSHFIYKFLSRVEKRRGIIKDDFYSNDLSGLKRAVSRISKLKNNIDVVNFTKGNYQDEYLKALRAVKIVKKFEKVNQAIEDEINNLLN